MLRCLQDETIQESATAPSCIIALLHVSVTSVPRSQQEGLPLTRHSAQIPPSYSENSSTSLPLQPDLDRWYRRQA